MTDHASSPQEMPGYKGPWYHGTTLNAAAEIVRGGFSLHCYGIPNTAPKGAVYFTTSIRRAMMWAEVHTFGQPVILKCSLHPSTRIADAGHINYTLINSLVERYSWTILHCWPRKDLTDTKQLTGPELVALYAYALHATIPSKRHKLGPRVQRKWLLNTLRSYGYQAIYRDFIHRMDTEHAPDNELMVFDPQLIQVDAVYGLLQADGSRIPDLQGDHLIDASLSWQLGSEYALETLRHKRWPDGPDKTLQTIVNLLRHNPKRFKKYQDVHENLLQQINELLEHIPCTSLYKRKIIDNLWYIIYGQCCDLSLKDAQEYIRLAAKHIPDAWRKLLTTYIREQIGSLNGGNRRITAWGLRREICEIWLDEEIMPTDSGTGS